MNENENFVGYYQIGNANISGTLTFGSTKPEEKELRPEKIIYNNRTTIVYWNDGTKSISTCDVNDKFDKKIGFASCLLKKMYGKKVHGKRLFDRMIEGAECHNSSVEILSFGTFKEMSEPLVKLSKSIK